MSRPDKRKAKFGRAYLWRSHNIKVLRWYMVRPRLVAHLDGTTIIPVPDELTAGGGRS